LCLLTLQKNTYFVKEGDDSSCALPLKKSDIEQRLTRGA
jgi:hypothetical protein